ncbi:MAG: hypothetical protein R3F14_31305 [Polyangiaceae bacterium]
MSTAAPEEPTTSAPEEPAASAPAAAAPERPLIAPCCSACAQAGSPPLSWASAAWAEAPSYSASPPPPRVRRAPGAIAGAFIGYGIAILPLVLLAAIVAVCKSELWLLPTQKTIRLLTYRPWLRTPRVEEAPLSEYAGVRTAPMTDDYGKGTLVSLVTTGGEDVPLRQFSDESEAATFAEKLAAASGLWVRAAEQKPAEA